jgi:hypothetical protein
MIMPLTLTPAPSGPAWILRDTSSRAQILIMPSDFGWIVSTLASAMASDEPPARKRPRAGGGQS